MPSMGDRNHMALVEVLEGIETAALALGRAQVEGRRGTRERTALRAAYGAAWATLDPYVLARRREVQGTRRRVSRLLAALVGWL